MSHFGALNYDIDILPSALRTTTVQGTSRDLENVVGAKGVMVVLDWTVEADSVTLSLDIEHKDLTSGKYIILLSAADVTAIGTTTHVVFPGNLTVANGITTISQNPLGRIWRVKVTHADSDAATYSVSGTYIL